MLLPTLEIIVLVFLLLMDHQLEWQGKNKMYISEIQKAHIFHLQKENKVSLVISMLSK